MPSFGHFETVFKNLAELKNSFLDLAKLFCLVNG